MIEAIVEVWCSPMRMEDYSLKIIPLCAGEFYAEEDIKEYISWDFHAHAFGDQYESVKGLWKIVCKIGIQYINYYDWEGFPDADIQITYTEIFKGQCQEWVEMKYTWLELNGKIEDYFRKPWKKHLGLYGADYE